MINKIYLINEGGLPLYYFDKTGKTSTEDTEYILQSGFFVAIMQFANEMGSEELRFIVFESTNYVVKKFSNGLILIFASTERIENLREVEKALEKTATFVKETIEEEKMDPNAVVGSGKSVVVADKIKVFLVAEGLVDEESAGFDAKRSTEFFQDAIFKSIGYVPGQCNIGPEARQRRLITGLGGLVLTLLLFFGMYELGLLRELRLLLVIPLFMSFQGFYQYFFKFCVVNALKKQYDMV